ncbi:MAG: hypothetical protein GXP25_02855 [Planctomycetes bacterium]|nr:hypothetical protein [Planctomycetota bacterium]
MAVKKITGADIEFGNSIVGRKSGSQSTSYEACQYLLNEVDGIAPLSGWRNNVGFYQTHYATCGTELPNSGVWGNATNAHTQGSAYNYRDYGRKWRNYCIYGDLGHCEGCLPETTSAFDHVAALHGLYNLVENLMRQANEKLPDGQELFVTANNSDGSRVSSWGAHFNVLITRNLRRQIFTRKPHKLGMLASFFASSAPLFGQGHVLRRRDGKSKFVLSSRAHQTGVLVDPSTTVPFRRPIVNSRDERHASEDLARLHIICYDANLQQIGTLLRVWLTQAFLAAMEEGFFDSKLLLDDPVAAFRCWSGGFSVTTGRIERKCRLAFGGKISPVEWFMALTEALVNMHDAGLLPEEIVPDTDRILPIWIDSLRKFAEGNVTALAKRFDWALKLTILDRQMSEHGFDLQSPEAALLNQMYAHIDKERGLYFALEKAGFLETAVRPQRIAFMQANGPMDTRAFARKSIIEKFSDNIRRIDWGKITLEIPSNNGWGSRKTILLDHPGHYTQAEVGQLIEECRTVEDLCRAMETHDPNTVRSSSLVVRDCGSVEPGCCGTETQWPNRGEQETQRK